MVLKKALCKINLLFILLVENCIAFIQVLKKICKHVQSRLEHLENRVKAVIRINQLIMKLAHVLILTFELVVQKLMFLLPLRSDPGLSPAPKATPQPPAVSARETELQVLFCQFYLAKHDLFILLDLGVMFYIPNQLLYST